MKKTLEYILLVILAGLLFAGICFICEKTGITTKKPCVKTDWEFCEDSIVCSVDTLTVEDVLEFRETVKESIKADSVFITMPEPILRYILENYGTELSNVEIMEIYDANKPFFNGLIKGKETTEKEFNKKVDILKHKLDSLKKLKDEKTKTNLRECRAQDSECIRDALIFGIKN